jgi:predicted signal transduction protein with EAL and GGDEF domain
MAIAIQNHGVITLEELHVSKEFLALTERQGAWIDSFLQSQDAGQATRIAYGDHTDPVYRAMLTRKIETSARVLAALDLFYGRSAKEKFLRDLQLDINRAKGVARIEARRLFAKVAGLDGSPSEPEHAVCNVGDIVLVDGVQHRVTAVDENGRPTDGEPL